MHTLPLPQSGLGKQITILFFWHACIYRPIFYCIKPKIIKSKQWSAESLDRPQDCFEQTDWSVYTESCKDLKELTDTISGFSHFCEDSIVLTKRVKRFPNNKPWITKEIKGIINRKKGEFGKK